MLKKVLHAGRSNSGFILNSCRACRGGGSIDVLSLEGLLRMAVALDRNQLAYPASARMIALTIQNEVNGFRRLRTDERVIEIRSGTQGQIR